VLSVKEGEDSKSPELVYVAFYPKSGSKILSYSTIKYLIDDKLKCFVEALEKPSAGLNTSDWDKCTIGQFMKPHQQARE